MKNLEKLVRDSGMFSNSTYLRKRLRETTVIFDPSKYQKVDRAFVPKAIDQTDLIKLMDNMTADPGTSVQWQPLPMERFPFERVAAESEAIELPDGVFVSFHSLLPMWQAGLLPEATSEEQVAIMQASCQPRVPSQWWLITEDKLLNIARENQIPLLYGDDDSFAWVPTFDEELQDNFYKTSIGFCLWQLTYIL